MADATLATGRPGAARPGFALALLAAAAVAACAAFMTVGVRGDWGFVLPFRAVKLAGLILVGVAIATSAVLFQTLTQNRILSPAIMGFDALYVAIQTALVFVLGARDLTALDPRLRFLFEAGVMIAASMLLFRWLIVNRGRSLHLMVLAGVVFGVLFRSLASMLQRILDPNEFSVLQDLLFASFNSVDASLLGVSAAVILIVCAAAFRMSEALDVMALGRETAIGLGLDYRRMVDALLLMIAVLVSVSTTLVGPVTFFGLLVANLAYALAGTGRHRFTLPAASLIAVVALVGGQTLLERAFGMDTALSVIIEFVGGIVFILLLLRGSWR